MTRLPGQTTDPLDGAAQVLLLGPTDTVGPLINRIGAERLQPVEDPYDALETLARDDCDAVILAGPAAEEDGLARAIRRLNSRTRVLTFCRPEDYPRVSRRTRGLVDACCLMPPTRGELASLLRAPNGTEGLSIPPTGMVELINATHSPEQLEQAIATRVTAVLGSEARWVDATETPPGAEPLLILPSQPPRLLLAQEAGRIDPTQEAHLADLHELLPALLGVSRRIESLHRLAITDHLTGAYNRRYFYQLTHHVLRRAESEGFRATLLLYDIDDFKQYNDQFGHAVGDEILRDTAAMIKTICRDQDIVARIGGDEFAVLFWDPELRSPDSQPLRDAMALSQRFRRAVVTHEFASLGPNAVGTLTVSGGLASFPDHGRTCLDLLRHADHGLHEAKTAGKNAIRLIGGDVTRQ